MWSTLPYRGFRSSRSDENGLRAKFAKWIAELKAAFASKDDTKITATLEAAPPIPTHDEESPGGVHVHIPATSGSGEAARSKYTDEKLDEEFGKVRKESQDNHKLVMDGITEIKNKLPKESAEDAAEREVEGALKEEAPAATNDAAMKENSAFLQKSYRETVALAEIIAPGIQAFTFDSAQRPARTYLDICKLRARALSLGNNDPAVNSMIEQANGGRAITGDQILKLPCSNLRTMFYAVAALKKAANNAPTTDVNRSRGADRRDAPLRIATQADQNKRNSEYYAAQK